MQRYEKAFLFNLLPCALQKRAIQTEEIVICLGLVG